MGGGLAETNLDFLLGEGDTRHQVHSGGLIGLAVPSVCIFEYHLVLGTAIGFNVVSISSRWASGTRWTNLDVRGPLPPGAGMFAGGIQIIVVEPGGIGNY